jgi:hypothetical protein
MHRSRRCDTGRRFFEQSDSSPIQPEDTMMFPSLSRVSEPLLGADQPTASSGPPRDKRSHVSHLVPRGKRRPGVIRIRVLTTAAAATHLQPHPQGTAMSGTATPPVAPRRASQFLRRHPKSLQGPSRSTRLIQVASPCWRASGLIGLDTGPRIHRRSLPGHSAHHHAGRKGRHPERWQQQLGSRRSDAAGRGNPPRPRGALRNDLRRRHRRSAASKPSDQELGEARSARPRASRRQFSQRTQMISPLEALSQVPSPPAGLFR